MSNDLKDTGPLGLGPSPWRPRRGQCPECNGSGFVFVMPRDTREMVPLKRQGEDWQRPSQRTCGVCGGDGIVGDEWRGKPGKDPIEWYMSQKEKYANFNE